MNYDRLINGILGLKDKGLGIFSLGKSCLNQDIWCAKCGRGGRKGIVVGGTHSREWITTALTVALAEREAECAYDRTVYFVPCLNPDGVRLALDGADFIADEEVKRYLIELNGGEDFSLYKSNGRGVDINLNFPARFGEGKSNLKSPSKENYIGEYPASENETQAIMKLTERVLPDFTVSYHSKGEVVYYGLEWNASLTDRDRPMAERVSRTLSYDAEVALGSCGGYKDWCLDALGIPSLTVEVGSDALSHPIGEESLPVIFEQNKLLLDVIFDSL